ncbi:hypothetical protein [Plantactinospora sonchi]|uniref:PPE family domain-containing protein n=1 Tax=Plantactinospora sonchi TaxID=1544735 RepID=A0ABU7RT01_9ACTN
MLDAGGGGGYAGSTNWYGFNTREMWARLANQDTEPYWKQVSAWKKTADLSSMHLSRLKQYRDGLAEAWPPEKNEAARAYVERLDDLINVVQGVYDTSSSNHQTLSNITLAVSEARRNLEPVLREYEEKERAKKDYEDTNPLLAIFKDEVKQSDLDAVDNKARSIMYSLSGELAGAQVRLQKPPVLEKGGGRTGGDDVNDSPMGNSYPPVLPPVAPMPTGGGSATYTTSPTPAIHTVVPTQTAPGVGPVLGNTSTLTPPTVSPTPSPIITPSPTPTPGPGLPGPFPPPSTGLPPGPKPPGLPPTPGYPNSSNLGQGGPKTGLGNGGGLPPRAMPPGGMIGGSPGSGLGQPAPGAGAARRINPIGGVIGGGGAGGSAGTTPLGGAGQRPGMGGVPASGAGRPGAGMGRNPMSPGQNLGVPPSSRAGAQKQDEENNQHWDPDNPWETDEGVAPVMMPSRPTGRIDPGPAIGYNR